MKNLMKCAAILAATLLAFGFASCKTNSDDDSGTIAVTSVELNKTSTSIGVGEAETLTATVKPDNATDKTVTWSSNKAEVATVDKGVVTAVSKGTATITAKAGDKTATCTVTVTAARQSGSISYSTASVEKTTASSAFTNELTKTGDGTVTYASSDTGVATVIASTGEVTIVGEGTATITATVTDSDTYYYATKTASYTLTVTAAAAKIVDLSTLTEDTVVDDGYTITGTLAAAVKVSIADGATVTLSGASINADSKLEGQSIAGLTCEGDATIIIADGSENTIRGIKKGYNVNGAGIFVPEGKTLTINGDTGILNAYGLGGAGIGANKNDTAGNVVITGGVITATGDTGIGCSDFADIGDITITGGTVTASSASSSSHAGIGASSGRECGNILITGGTVTANGKNTAPGIGCGGVRNGQVGAKCGTITIADTVTKVTATKGVNGTHGIGLDTGSSCGTITIGGTVFWDGTSYQNDGETILAASPFSYPKIVDLSTLTESTTVDDGFIITGTMPSKYMTITIADGATVTLKNVDMSIGSGIKCVGDATITLAADSTNVIQGLYDKAGIYVPENSTLIINGTGSLDVTASNDGAGIGGGWGQVAGNIEIQSGNITARGGVKGAGIGGGENGKCGNITISGGNVTAIGGENGAGIGGGKLTSNNHSDCGNIVISGGTVIATGGENAAGIGGGSGNVGEYKSTCGSITIAATVTSVTATKGSGAPYSIGAGNVGTCGTVTIGDDSTTYAAGISESPYTYPPSN